LRLLPIDPEKGNFVRDPVKDSIFSVVQPKPIEKPRVVLLSKNALSLIDVDADSGDEGDEKLLASYLCGNAGIPGSEPAAHCYCGYQFGSFAG